MRLGPPLRGVIYGIGAIASAAVWFSGRWAAALIMGAVVIVGIGLEIDLSLRR